MKFIISIDQGTTSTRSCLLDQTGAILATSQKSFEQIYPKPGWVEHDPSEIWQTTLSTLQDLLKKTKIDKNKIAAIGITNQRETVVAWDRITHKPLYNAIVWQCRRTQDLCLRLKKFEKGIYKKTGLVLDPYFSATKIQWLLQNLVFANSKKLQKQVDRVCVGTIDSWLLWNLTAGQSHQTDVSNASRTMLMNLKTLQWDADLLKFFKIPAEILPQIRPSNAHFGVTAGLGFLPDGIPIHGILGDQQVALFGQACFKPGQAKCTFGTGSFLLMNSGHKVVQSKHRLLSTVAWQLEKHKTVYAVEGGAYICGAAVQWLRDGLQMFKKSAEVEDLAASVADSAGVEFIPALAGLGAPYWSSEARGLICGLTRGTTKAHIARATLEAMALQNVEILLAMQKDLGSKISTIKVDGGATANNLLMQLQADYLGLDILRPQVLESTALGAGLMAGLGAGLWKSLSEIEKLWKLNQKFKSTLNKQQRQARLDRWQKAVGRALLGG
ncbi:MAG: glycerol kinase GlpK [Pseudobdellovibrionaceae bacterium]